MEKDIENLIEELTKVRPEMLNEEALKLFNTIMAVLDERDKLIKENQELINELQDKDDEIRFANRDIKVFETEFIPKSKIKEIVDKNLRQNALVGCEGYCYGFNECQQLAKEIVELMEDK